MTHIRTLNGHTIIYPRYEKDKKLIEGVQRRATKIIQELKGKEYPDRLKTLKLPSMQYRRDRGDMIETYKSTHGKYTSNYPFTNDEDISKKRESETEREREREREYIEGASSRCLNAPPSVHRRR